MSSDFGLNCLDELCSDVAFPLRKNLNRCEIVRPQEADMKTRWPALLPVLVFTVAGCGGSSSTGSQGINKWRSAAAAAELER